MNLQMLLSPFLDTDTRRDTVTPILIPEVIRVLGLFVTLQIFAYGGDPYFFGMGGVIVAGFMAPALPLGLSILR